MSGFDEAAYDCWHCKAKAKYILSLTGRGLKLSKRIAELEAALKEIQDHCAGKTGSLQAVVVVIVRKALEGK
jgi:hypothetical protein